MRDRAVRRLHGTCERRRGALLRTTGGLHRRAFHHHHRGCWRDCPRRCRAEGLAGPGSRAVRLLSIRPDHVGERTAAHIAASQRRRYRCGHGGQYLPLRRVCTHSRGDQEGRASRLGRLSMTNTAIARPQSGVDPRVTRRAFLGAGLGVGGALLVGFHVPATGAVAQGKGPFAPNAFIRIDRNGTLTLIMPQVEMGQGVYTSVAMILAEELDAAFEQVTLEHAPPNDKLYGNPTFGIQVTGNSNSIRAFWMPLRK